MSDDQSNPPPTSPWDDPQVKSALKSGREPRDIWLLNCPACGCAGYYNQGPSFSCRICGSSFPCVTEDECEEIFDRPTIVLGEEYALSDWEAWDAGDEGGIP